MSEYGLERLEVWKMAKEFSVSVYQDALYCLPNEEKWGLSHQLRRAAQSIPANIAEGYGRYYYLDNVRFCYIARGSLEETFSHLVLAYELGYLPAENFQRLSGKYKNLLRLLNGYIAYLKKSRKGENEQTASAIEEGASQPYITNVIEDETDE